MKFKRRLFVFAGITLTPFFFVRAEVRSSTATGDSIFYDNVSGVAVVDGNARVETSTAILTADKITANMQTKDGHLEGNVKVVQSSSVLTGTEVFYNWQASTGVLLNAAGYNPPWTFSADRMFQVSHDRFRLEEAELTSCDGDPPHFRFRSSTGKVWTGHRASMKNMRMVLDETPVFWSPFFRRSLIDKKYTLRIEPGSSSRDGLITKTTFGYPFTPRTRTKLKWDYFQKTGNGFGVDHRYGLENLRGGFDSYYIYDNNPDPQPQSRRWDVNWNHYQKLMSRLTANARVNFKSDQTFGNSFLGSGTQGRVENQTRGLLSEGGLNYQFPRASLQAQFDRRDRFDTTVSSKSFVGKVTAPRLSYNTIPLQWKYFPVYTSFSASYANETQDRFTPQETLRYRRSASVGTQLKRDLRLARRLTVTPRAGYSQTWQDRDYAKTNATNDLYLGRYNTGLDVRTRLRRLADITLSHNYTVRTEPNRTTPDTLGDDRGIETNLLNTSLVSRVGRNSRLSLSSGYDLKNAPRSDPSRYRHESSRITPPTLDAQWQVTPNVNIFFRETYSIFDTATRTVRRTPLNTSGEIQVGHSTHSFTISQGFNYSKTAVGQPAVLHLNNRLRMYATNRWYFDLFLSYRGVGPKGLNYKKFLPTEKTFRAVRDMHCWLLRMEFSDRVGRREASFYIDLKANLSTQKNLFRDDLVASPFIGDPVDEADVFPVNE